VASQPFELPGGRSKLARRRVGSEIQSSHGRDAASAGCVPWSSRVRPSPLQEQARATCSRLIPHT
jgi:hypothetical protein